jgi:hypothetical protein
MIKTNQHHLSILHQFQQGLVYPRRIHLLISAFNYTISRTTQNLKPSIHRTEPNLPNRIVYKMMINRFLQYCIRRMPLWRRRMPLRRRYIRGYIFPENQWTSNSFIQGTELVYISGKRWTCLISYCDCQIQSDFSFLLTLLTKHECKKLRIKKELWLT